MNIQTERLEDHTARFTVEIEMERLDKAKQAAARQIAKRVNIPGFRKGKAPYSILVQYVGEANILNDAIEDLSQEVYRETLEQSDIDPYGPGSWQDFKLEPNPTFIYTVPLQPTLELGDYRSIRRPFEPPTVEDEMVDRAMKRLQEQEALVEESARPAAVGNRVTLDIHSEFVDDPPDVLPQTDEGEQPADSNEEAERKPPAKGESFLHEHDAVVTLDLEDEPVLPGFSAALVGATAGQEVEFELTAPHDDDDYKDIAGRRIKFHVTVKKIEVVTLPALNDDLAARITQSEAQPLTLLELRMRMRDNLQQEMNRRYQSDYANHVLDDMVALAAISHPEAMVIEQSETLLDDFEQRLKQQGLSLETYMKVTGRTREDLLKDYRDPAINIIRRSLVLKEIGEREQISVSDEEITKEINDMVAQFGENAAQVRGIFDTPAMRANIRNDLMRQRIFDRITEIARGLLSAASENLDDKTAETSH